MAELDAAVVDTPAPEPVIPTESPAELAAKRTRKSVIHPGSEHPLDITDIKSQEEFETLASGKKFKGEDGEVRTKPYFVTDDSSFDDVPEGSQFVDPKGELRTKPKYEGIDYTAQTLYDMAYTDKEKRKALERSYPGKVKEDSRGELFIEDEGVMRKPGRGINAATGFVTAAAAPTAGAVLGAVGGGAAGSGVPFVGNIAGGVVGAGVGSAVGQGINDIALQLAGIYDRSAGEEALNLGTAAAAGMVGEGVGRGVAAFIPSAKAGASKVSSLGPAAGRKFLGAAAEDLEMAESLGKQGVMVPPSTVFKKSPHIINVAERFYPGFDTSDPMRRSIEEHFEKGAGKLLGSLGVKEPGSLLKPTEAVPLKEVGEAFQARAIQESQRADSELVQALEKRKLELASGVPEKMAQREAVLQADAESKKAVRTLIDSALTQIQKEADAAFKVAGAHGNSSEMWQMVGDELVAVRRGAQERHTLWYQQADQAAGEHLPNSAGLSVISRDFLEQLPEGFQGQYPKIVQQLRDLAGVTNDRGEIVKETVDPTFGQLHNLRSMLRNNVKWYDVAPDIKDGVYKFFSKRVDDILHDENAVPELQLASHLLAATDKSYGETFRIFKDAALKQVVRGLESGAPADEKMLYNTIVKEGRPDLAKKVEKMVGPNLWAGVRGADLKAILDSAKTLDSEAPINGGIVAKEILSRHRENMLEVVHGKEATARLLSQAKDLAALDGKLSIPYRPGDTMTMVMERAKATAEAVKKVVNQDPLQTLALETKKAENAFLKQAAAQRKKDPLSFLNDPSYGGIEAAKKLLGSEDLILSASTRFGNDSKEMNALRQVYALGVLRGDMDLMAKLAKISPEIQKLIFKDATFKELETLAKEFQFLMGAKMFQGGDVAGGMSTLSKVENPYGGGFVGGKTKVLPGVNTTGRAMRELYYETITNFVSKNPALFTYLMRGLRGTEEQKQATRAILSKVMQRGGAVGAGAGEAEEQAQ